VTRPNIVWILTDEWRHDAAGYAGNPVISTPNLDALAARGTAFRNAHCESPVCQPSRASLLTCRFPTQHEKRQNGTAANDREGWPIGDFPRPEDDNILHRLRAAGYRTAAVGKMHFDWGPYDAAHAAGPDLSAFGFDESAEEYDKHVLAHDAIDTPYTRYLAERGLLASWRVHAHEQTEILFGRDPAGRPALAEELAPADTLDAFIGRQASAAIPGLAAQSDPFFLWVGFVGPHPPFDGPRELSDAYDIERIPMGPLGFDGYPDNRYGELLRFCVQYLNSDQYTEADYRLMAKHYYGAITLIDAQIAGIVAALEEAGVVEDTWLFFSSDHGELLGDHGLITKAVFYDSSVRVPIVVTPPPGAHCDASADAFVQGIDVPATILDLAGADRSGLAGASLLPADEVSGRTAVFSEISAFTMVATAEWKLVVESATLEPQALYDLVRDPDERVDLSRDPAHSETIAGLVDTRLRPYLAGDPASAASGS
jgi:arylsulfatase